MSDLDELVLRCRTEQAKEYFLEAVNCYRAGAYRASIVNTWIAIVFDLIDKIRELSVSGDKIAEGLLKQFESYQQQIDQGNDQGIKSALEFERNILTIVRDKLQLLDQQQFLDLYRLREDRHRCAHPSFQRIEDTYRPTAELARVHLKNALIHVLQQQPIQGKAALNELKALVSSQYFPTDHEKAIIQLRNSAFKRPNEALIKGFVDLLIFGFFEDGNPLKSSDQVISAINALIVLNRDIVESRLKKQINKIINNIPDKKFFSVVFISFFVKDLWALLEESSRNKIHDYILKGPDKNVIAILELAASHEELLSTVKKRANQLSLENLSEAINSYHLKQVAIPIAIDWFTKVRSWIEANEVADKLVLPLLPYFTEANVEEILNSIPLNQPDLLGSHGFNSFLIKVRELGIVTVDNLNEMLAKNGLDHYTRP